MRAQGEAKFWVILTAATTIDEAPKARRRLARAFKPWNVVIKWHMKNKLAENCANLID